MRKIARRDDVAGVVGDAPTPSGGIGQRRGAVVGHLGVGREGLFRGPHEFLHPQKRHRRPGELAELLRSEDAFGIPEGIQQTHQRLALPGKIFQLEQEKAAVARRAKGCFHVLFIYGPRESSRGDLKIVGLADHAAGGQGVAERLEIARL